MRLVFIAYHLLLYLLAEISFGEKDGGHARVTVVLLPDRPIVFTAPLSGSRAMHAWAVE